MVIFFLMLVLLIPTFMILELISEREGRQREAIFEVSSKWGQSQTLYARSLFDSNRMALLVGGTLALLYGFLFVVLQQQDYALLIGSLGLFIILAAVMYFSRKINWQ